MAKQLVFDLPVTTGFDRDDFFTSPANDVAVQMIENWRDWPQNKLVLSGPEGAGKTHLAQIWAELSGAQVVQAMALEAGAADQWAAGAVCLENVHLIAGNAQAEAALFHLHNLLQETGQPLLMTGRDVVSNWNIALADLNSRLLASSVAKLSPPDDGLLSAVLLKQFADRQMRVEPGLISHLLRRMDRSFAMARRLVDRLDAYSLRDKKPIGVKMATQVLVEFESEE